MKAFTGFLRIRDNFSSEDLNKEEMKKETAGDAICMPRKADGRKCALIIKEYKGAGCFGFNAKDKETNYSCLEISPSSMVRELFQAQGSALK